MAAATCPRCGRGFDCGAHGAGPCACAAVTLDAPARAALQARYAGCLCVPCLEAVARGDAPPPPPPPPAHP